MSNGSAQLGAATSNNTLQALETLVDLIIVLNRQYFYAEKSQHEGKEKKSSLRNEIINRKIVSIAKQLTRLAVDSLACGLEM